jgi:hypothetical protein
MNPAALPVCFSPSRSNQPTMKPGSAAAPRAELIDAAKNWLAMDGLWFQAVEKAFGMDTALAWTRSGAHSLSEAMRIKRTAHPPDNGGLDARDRI